MVLGGEEWLTMRRARELLKPLGISDQTIRNWADAGRIKSTRLGPDGKTGHRRFAKSSIDKELARYQPAEPAEPTPVDPPAKS